MKHFGLRMTLTLGILLCIAGCGIAAGNVVDLSALLGAAKAGQTVTLPAGTFTTTGAVIPHGVSLRGAGYGQTTLQVSGANGLTIDGGGQAWLSDLTISDASNAGIQVAQANGITISRVRTLHCLTGIMVRDSTQVRIENVVAAQNRTGVVLNGCAKSVVANCTLAANTALGISLGVNPDTAVFNLLIVNSPIGVYVAPANTSLLLDHNFYMVNSIGKCNDILEPNVFVWRDATGYDHHSLSMSLAFADDAPCTYRTSTRLSWAQDRAVTSGWGAGKLGAFRAPARDIDGHAYNDGPCVGAWEVSCTPSRPADGVFTIHSSDGTKSAGLYTKDGRHVAWLFSNLPLKAGAYRFWVPSRDWQGRPLPAGDYVVRLAEANLSLKAVGSGVGGNTGYGASREGLAQISNQQVIYDSKERPVVALAWSESGMNIRAFAANSPQERWFFPGTATHLGIASDGQGLLYTLRLKGKEPELLCLDEESGQTRPFADARYDHYYAENAFSAQVGGMAILDWTLYLADSGNNRLRTAPLADPVFAPGSEVPSPSSPCADRQRKLVWVLSAHTTIMAIDETGAVKYQFPCPVPGAQALAVNGNRLAILSYETGKVHLFDCTDPAHLQPLRTIGSGDGPYGAIEPDRFGFKGGHVDDGALPRLALNAAGDIALVDIYGVKEFASDGTVKRNLIGGWFNSFHLGLPDTGGNMRVMDLSTPRSFLLDAKTQTSRPEGTWDLPGPLVGMFEYQGQHYGLYGGALPATLPDSGQKYSRPYACIAKLDEAKFIARPLLAYSWGTDTTMRTDFSTPLEASYDPAHWKPFLGADGKPSAMRMDGVTCRTNGDLVIDYARKLSLIHLLGFDERGVPNYDWAHPREIVLSVEKDDSFISPYDYKTKETVAAEPPNHVVSFLADGGFARACSLRTGRMEALTGNWAGTDLVCFNADGTLRWLQPMTELNGVVGAYAVDNLVYSMHITTSETQVFSSDGLFLGRLGQPRGLPWGGKWLDNGCQYAPYRGSDGKHYMVYGDFNDCCFFWMSIEGEDRIQREQVALHLTEQQAAALAVQPLPEPAKPVSLPVTHIKIVKLAAPMTIDGSLEKWRTAVPVPQVIMTPESGSPDITGPADASALLRFAHENGNLYVQVIKFDDMIVLGQPLANFYLQDGVEMTINSFASGFKFNVTRVKDLGDIILRDRFYNTPPSKLLDPLKAPRNITIYDNAQAFPERKLIENFYGIDLSNSKVLVTEFKIPLNAETYENDVPSVPASTSGSTIWLGVMVDDNDVPGGDVQKYLLWPSTYGTFNSKETGAIATFE